MSTIYSIGHSTRPIDEFIGLLRAREITQLMDIRTIPRSRHNPQHEQDALSEALDQAGISYVYLKWLGGLRSSHKGSPNTAWRNKSFRNYADYMQTDEFRDGVDELIRLGERGTTAIMCAEAVPNGPTAFDVGNAPSQEAILHLALVRDGSFCDRSDDSDGRRREGRLRLEGKVPYGFWAIYHARDTRNHRVNACCQSGDGKAAH